MHLFEKSKELSGIPGEPEYEELTRRIQDFSNRWETLKLLFERRIQLGIIYQEFHKSAVEVNVGLNCALEWEI